MTNYQTILGQDRCEKRIYTVKSYNKKKDFIIFNLEIINRDIKKNDDVIQLNPKGIWVLDAI
jgi:hypothetical protein